MMFGALIVMVFLFAAFVVALGIFVLLVLLFLFRVRKKRNFLKVLLGLFIGAAVVLVVPTVFELCQFHIQRRPYVKKLKSYIPPELRKEVPSSFFNDIGGYDLWRFALVYPYRVSMIDSPDRGDLENVRADNPEVGGELTHLSFDSKLMVAKVSYRDIWEEKKPETFWIVFEFSSGKFDRFDSEEEALSEANRRGFTGKQVLENLKTYYDRFVGNAE